ncbi:YbaN family protein [Methylopila musalis]|uniref:YbaN family protein n=1 Tax=Methylopila musalis TaxID=1134781 RepID=A0ABW3Z9D9_9HYPH
MRRNEGDGTEPRAETAHGPFARFLWLGAGVVALALGVVGVILPVMPGTVFLILAAACFARGSPRLERWLLAHPTLGPAVVAWRRDGVIPPRAKLLAFAGMAVSIVIVALSDAPPIALAATILLVGAGAIYVGSRPSRPKD